MKPVAAMPSFAPLAARWRSLSPRDRRIALVGAWVFGLYAVWALAVQPAWRALDRAPVEIDRLDAQWLAMQRLAAESGELRAAPPVTADQAAAALKAATDRLGDAGRLVLQGDRAVLTLKNVGTGALRDWLTEARAGARARPIEARLARSGSGYSGTLVVAIGGTS